MQADRMPFSVAQAAVWRVRIWICVRLLVMVQRRESEWNPVVEQLLYVIIAVRTVPSVGQTSVV